MAEVHLPERIELTLVEARDVLFALDRAAELGEPGPTSTGRSPRASAF